MLKIWVHLILVIVAGVFLEQTLTRSFAQVAETDEQVVHISASTFRFTPDAITVKKGVPVILELTSRDRRHGFELPAFHLRADVKPGAVEKLLFVPDKAGTFSFFCNFFCGDGMTRCPAR